MNPLLQRRRLMKKVLIVALANLVGGTASAELVISHDIPAGFRPADPDVGPGWIERTDAIGARGEPIRWFLSLIMAHESGEYRIEAVVFRPKILNIIKPVTCTVTFGITGLNQKPTIKSSTDSQENNSEYKFISPPMSWTKDTMERVFVGSECSSYDESNHEIKIPYRIEFLVKGPFDGEFREIQKQDFWKWSQSK